MATWISDYLIEFLPGMPHLLQVLGQQRPANWALVVLGEFRRRGDVGAHLIASRSRIKKHMFIDAEGATYHVLKASRIARLLCVFWMDAFRLPSLFRLVQTDLVHARGIERPSAPAATRLNRPNLATNQRLLGRTVSVVPSVQM